MTRYGKMGAESWKGFLAQPQADAGWPGFTYTKDTVRFFERHYAIMSWFTIEAIAHREGGE